MPKIASYIHVYIGQSLFHYEVYIPSCIITLYHTYMYLYISHSLFYYETRFYNVQWSLVKLALCQAASPCYETAIIGGSLKRGAISLSKIDVGFLTSSS